MSDPAKLERGDPGSDRRDVGPSRSPRARPFAPGLGAQAGLVDATAPVRPEGHLSARVCGSWREGCTASLTPGPVGRTGKWKVEAEEARLGRGRAGEGPGAGSGEAREGRGGEGKAPGRERSAALKVRRDAGRRVHPSGPGPVGALRRARGDGSAREGRRVGDGAPRRRPVQARRGPRGPDRRPRRAPGPPKGARPPGHGPHARDPACRRGAAGEEGGPPGGAPAAGRPQLPPAPLGRCTPLVASAESREGGVHRTDFLDHRAHDVSDTLAPRFLHDRKPKRDDLPRAPPGGLRKWWSHASMDGLCHWLRDAPSPRTPDDDAAHPLLHDQVDDRATREKHDHRGSTRMVHTPGGDMVEPRR